MKIITSYQRTIEMNSEHEVWEEVKSFYREKFGTAPELVEIAPILDFLRLCASGAGNESIAKFFNESEQMLMEIFDAYLGFMGWREDLHFSPLKYYKDWNLPTIEEFKDQMAMRFGNTPNNDIAHMYESARIVEKLERLFDEKWI